MSEIIDLAAEALWNVQTKPWSEVAFESTDEENKYEIRKEVRAVIKALASYYEAGIIDAGYGNRPMSAETYRIAKTTAEELRRILVLA